MALGTLGAIALGGSVLKGAAGAIAGSKGKKSTQETTSGINLGEASRAEELGGIAQQEGLTDFRNLVRGGPGGEDVTRATESTRGLAALQEQLAATGGLPGQAEFQAAQQFSQQAFRPQELAIQQGFEQERIRTERQAARLGRQVDDPILQAKLGASRIQAEERLGAQRSAFTAQFAQQLPFQRLQLAQQAAATREGLATQALQRRSELVNLGGGIQARERQFRLASGERFSSGTTKSGGGLGGAISGAIGGIGSGLSAGLNLGQGLGFSDVLTSQRPLIDANTVGNADRIAVPTVGGQTPGSNLGGLATGFIA